jgi:hypothetical protein
MSLLPISPETIMYGSNNYGKTIHNKNATLFSEIEKLAKALNLKLHSLNEENLYTPGFFHFRSKEHSDSHSLKKLIWKDIKVKGSLFLRKCH